MLRIADVQFRVSYLEVPLSCKLMQGPMHTLFKLHREFHAMPLSTISCILQNASSSRCTGKTTKETTTGCTKFISEVLSLGALQGDNTLCSQVYSAAPGLACQSCSMLPHRMVLRTAWLPSRGLIPYCRRCKRLRLACPARLQHKTTYPRLPPGGLRGNTGMD